MPKAIHVCIYLYHQPAILENSNLLLLVISFFKKDKFSNIHISTENNGKV